MSRVSIKSVSIETEDMQLYKKIYKLIDLELEKRFGKHYRLRNVPSTTFSLYDVRNKPMGDFFVIYEAFKSEMDTIVRVLDTSLNTPGERIVQIFPPNLYTFIKYNMESYTDMSQPDIIGCRSQFYQMHRDNGTLGISCNKRQILDKFDNCGYTNYNYDLMILLTPCKHGKFIYGSPTSDLGFVDYVAKYLLRNNCPNKHLNGIVKEAIFDPSDDKCINKIVELIVDDINLYGIS